jgi:hypothetical protein
MLPIAQTRVSVVRPSLYAQQGQHLNHQLLPTLLSAYQRQRKFKANPTQWSLMIQI